MKHAIASLLLVSGLGAFAPVSSAQDAPFANAERVLHLHSQTTAWRTFRREGGEWRYPETAIGTEALAADDPLRTVTFGESVRFGFAGFDPAARVTLRVAFVSDSDERVVQVVVDGAVVEERLALPFAEVVVRDVAFSPVALEDGRVELEVRRLAGPNAVVASIEVWSDTPAELAPIPKEPVVPVDMPRPRLTPRPMGIAGGGPRTMDLGGQWSFHPSPPANFADVGAVAQEGWTTIEVPGEWTMQGFDVPGDRTVGYRRAFTVPRAWYGRRVKLRCDSVYGHAVLYVDGRQAAVSERTFTPFEVDLTDLVTPGKKHVFAWAITNDCLADALTYGTGYARHPLGGILRRLTLFAVPDVHVARFHVETPLDEAYDDAMLRVLLTLANEGALSGGTIEVAVGLTAPRGAPVDLLRRSFSLPVPDAGTTRDHVLEIPVASPAKWHPEHPNLYRLALDLTLDSAPLEILAKRVGFRQVEVRGTQLLVNGRPTKLRGVNRHEAHPLYGRALREPLWRQDAELFRDANVNFVRTSHYPPDERFLDACDELGLFVEVESPITWIGHGAASQWKEWDYRDERYLPYLTRCALEMIERDRSHPCVILWSLGNESLWSHNWERVAATARLADPTRPFVFHDQAYGGFNNQGSDLDVANIHYPGPNGAERVASGFDRPVLFGEYCHLNVYNRQELLYDPGLRDTWGEALAPMWEAMVASDVVVGGAIWSGISDRFLLGDREVGYGSWGPIDGWRRKKPEYWHVFKCYSPLRVITKEIPVPAPGEEIVLEVENRMEWTDLSELMIEFAHGRPYHGENLGPWMSQTWELEWNPGTVVASGAPGTTGTVRIGLEDPPPWLGISYELGQFQPGDSVWLIFRSKPHRNEPHHQAVPSLPSPYYPSSPGLRVVDEYLLPIGTPPSAPPLPPPATVPVLHQLEDRVEVAAGDVLWSFDRGTGEARCTVAGREVVRGGPHLHITSLEKKYTLFLEVHDPGPLEPVPAHSAWRLDVLEVAEGEGTATVTARGAYGETAGWFAMEVDGAGELHLAYEFTHRGEPVDVQEQGVVFLAAAELEELQWQRDGQWSICPYPYFGSNAGRAHAFRVPGGAPDPLNIEPDWPWAEDQLPTGTNAFRGTKRNVRSITLTEPGGLRGIEVLSDGSQHTRTWVSGDAIRLLVAEFVSPGSETFLGSHWAHRRRVVETGEMLRGTAHLRPRIR